MKNGKLIVIEGSYGSEKEIQSKMLEEYLKGDGRDVLRITFPDYDSDSSALVKAYLRGDFGEKADDVNVYAASTFYAVDRFASFKQKWGEFYQNGGLVIADRYTTSNMIHQTAKIGNFLEKEQFLTWLWDLEYNLYNLPIPDQVIFLNIPADVSKRLRKARANKNGEDKDIHERDLQHMEKSYTSSLYIAERFKWDMINCTKDGKMKSRQEIQSKIIDSIII